jgi:hypothetical protein
MWRKCVGATLLELAVVVSVLGALAFVLLDRMAYYQERAEKANMETTATTLKIALLVEFSTLMVEGRMQESPALLRRNPMDWLAPKPANYLGEFNGIAPDTLPRGNWYYNSGARELVYRVNRGRYFTPDSRGRREVRFHVKANYDGAANKERVGASPMPPSGIKLVPVEAYNWF